MERTTKKVGRTTGRGAEIRGGRLACRIAIAWTIAILAPAGLAAQVAPESEPTRQDAWAEEQARKAADLHEDERLPLERMLLRAKGLFDASRPVGAYVGGVIDGGGIAVGPGVAFRVGDTGELSAHAAWSVKNAKGAAVRLTVPTRWDRVDSWAEATWTDTPEVGFHGLGPSSPAERAGGYALRVLEGGAGLRLRVARRATIGGEVGVLDLVAGATPGTPAAILTYGRSRLVVEFDTRAIPRVDTAGGRYRLGITDLRGAGARNFQQLEAETEQVLPFLRSNWTLVFHGLATETLTSPGHQVPMALLPALGGQSLRGYSAWRFRDRARAVATGEFRWATGPHLALAAFVDAGAVGSSIGALRSRDVATSHGLSVILHTPLAALARFDIARSREGFSVHFAVRPTF